MSDKLCKYLQKHKIYCAVVENGRAILVRKALNMRRYHQGHVVVYNLVVHLQEILQRSTRRLFRRRVRFNKTLIVELHDGCNIVSVYRLTPEIINKPGDLEETLNSIINSEIKGVVDLCKLKQF